MNFGGFTDEPIELPDDMPDFSMGKGPGFMGKGPMIEGEWSMDDMADMPEMPELPENPLAAVQAQIASITDIDGVKVRIKSKVIKAYKDFFRVFSMPLLI